MAGSVVGDTLYVNLHCGGDEIANRRFWRHDHLYGAETPLDRHVQQQLRQPCHRWPSFHRRRSNYILIR